MNANKEKFNEIQQNIIPRTREIELFGKKIAVKNYSCARDGGQYKVKPDPPALQLSILPTGFCTARCPFCVAEANREKTGKLDLTRLEYVLKKLQPTGMVRGVSITGGEPMGDVEMLDDILHMVFQIFGEHLEVSMTTNGIKFDQISKLRDLSYLDQFHLSRHHYDDETNRKLFGGAPVPDAQEIKAVVDKISYRDVFVMNTMLLRDYIGTPDEAKKMLELAAHVGIPKVAFIDAIGATSFAREQHIDYRQVVKRDDPSILFTRGMQDHEFCRCDDGIYVTQTGQLEEFYGRCTSGDPCQYARGLGIGPDGHLRIGYAGEIIL